MILLKNVGVPLGNSRGLCEIGHCSTDIVLHFEVILDVKVQDLRFRTLDYFQLR